MKFHPLVSVVMNCHNGEKFLEKSIKSVIGQTYKKWELIFWNNCSNDNSKKIFKRFKDRRLKYFENKTLKNLYEARNFALSKCKGKYVCFLDTDDWWVKDKIKNQLKIFRDSPYVSIVYSNYYQFNQKFRKKYLFSKSQLPSGKITQSLLDSYKIGIITVMVKKRVFEKNKFEKKYNIIGDFDFFIRLSLNYRFKSIQNPLAYYRIHSTNYSKLNLSNYLDEIKTWLFLNEKKFKKKGYSLKFLKLQKFKIRVKRFLKF